MVVYTEKSKRLYIIKIKNLVRLLDIRSMYEKTNHIPIYQQRRFKKYYFAKKSFIKITN